MQADVYNTKRYLIDFNSGSLPHVFVDCLIIGSGIAGLRAAIEAARTGSVLILTKRKIYDSNTAQAQGGVAVVLKAHEQDNLDLHISDTLKVGCGLNDKEAVKKVVTEGPIRVRELIEWGAHFDSTGGELDLGREAGHSACRVLHSYGDATGKEIARTLLNKIEEYKNIRIEEENFVIDLLTEDNRCLGAIAYSKSMGLYIVRSKQTILATGGAGRIFQETTNPPIATGDGIALAWRAGAELQSMEMMQFHPTTLYIAGSSRALISEAVRGEGAKLVDKDGNRFMSDYHPDAELAPRDVVSRAIMHHLHKTHSRYVYLDARDIPNFAERFPQITEHCRAFGIDVSRDLIPVRPSAHYLVGGVKVDLNAKTSVEGLYACGEVASTGLHGANRLASNSLLEGLVFGTIAGQLAGEYITTHLNPIDRIPISFAEHLPSGPTSLDIQDMCISLRSLMWRYVGIKRDAAHLKEAIDTINRWGIYVFGNAFDYPAGWEMQNMLTVSIIMASAAYKRTESRGVHYREDYPEQDDEHWLVHIVQQRNKKLTIVPLK